MLAESFGRMHTEVLVSTVFEERGNISLNRLFSVLMGSTDLYDLKAGVFM